MLELIKLFLAKNPIAAHFTAQAIEAFLQRFQEGTNIDLYGCGSFGQAIIDNNIQSLSRLNIRFIQTDTKNETKFHKYPLISSEHAVKKPAKAILLLSHTYDVSMRECLKHYSGEVFGIKQALDITDLSPFIEGVKKFIANIASDFAKKTLTNTNGKPIIAYVTECPAFHTFKIMNEIRKLGYTIILCTNRGNITESIHINQFQNKDYFDAYYIPTAIPSLEFNTIMKDISPELIHAEVGMWPPFTLAEGIQKWGCPVIIDYRDVKEAVFSDANHACKFTKSTTVNHALEEEARKSIYSNSAGVIFKESTEIIDFLEKKYNCSPKQQLQYLPYLSDEYVNENPVCSGGKGLVYIGNVCYDKSWHVYPLFASLLEAGKILSEQKLHLTLYNSLDSTGEGYEDFLKLDRENPYFHYKFAVPYDQLTKELPQYDYGFFCFDYTKALEDPLYAKTAFASKIFTYLETGLPVVISNELEFMVKMLKEMNLAIPCSFQNLHALKSKLDTFNREDMLANLPQTRKKWTHKNNIYKLKALYKTVIEDSQKNKKARQ